MHIEKNVCESLIKFLFGTNDIINVCRDMKVCGVWPRLWLKRDPHKLDKIFKPITSYVLMLNELKTFMFMLKNLKLSLKYYGALRKHIMDKQIKVDEKPWLTCVDATTNVIDC